MQDFRKLRVWDKSHQLALNVYRLSTSFPRSEMYGLTSQIRRSSMSVPTNIAEGCGRGTDKDFANFLQIAVGSANELEYQLLLAKDLGLTEAINQERLNAEVNEVKRMLISLIQKLRAYSL